jgi:hypothetical protein
MVVRRLTADTEVGRFDIRVVPWHEGPSVAGAQSDVSVAGRHLDPAGAVTELA